MITVPSCPSCQAAMNVYEDDFRDILVFDPATQRNHTAQALLEGAVQRSAVDYNSSDMWKRFKTKGKIEPIHTPGGLFLGNFVTAPIEDERFTVLLSMMARGLHYYSRDKRRYPINDRRLPTDMSFEVRRIYPWFNATVWNDFLRAGANGPYRIAGDVFSCLMFFGEEDPTVTLWALCFYESIIFTVATEPKPVDYC